VTATLTPAWDCDGNDCRARSCPPASTRHSRADADPLGSLVREIGPAERRAACLTLAWFMRTVREMREIWTAAARFERTDSPIWLKSPILHPMLEETNFL